MRAHAIVLAVVILGAAVEAQITIRPGQYEISVDIQIGGVPADAPKAVLDAAGFQGQKKLECLTPEDVKGDITNVLARQMGDAEHCKMSDVKTAGNTLTFVTTCIEDGVTTVINSDMVFVGDSFTGVAKSKGSDGNVATVKTSARRVGECK